MRSCSTWSRGCAAPLLLISQRLLPATDLQLELTGLSVADVQQLWHAAGHSMPSQQAEQLHAYTGGNPRLLTLMLALQQESEDNALPGPGDNDTAPSLLPAFQRLWRRLVPKERRALQRLSVYQGYAPEDVLAPPTVEALARLRLIERDGEGGVTLLPALAPIVHADLVPELRGTLHSEAAVVRLERGEYTAAAYHFAQSNQEGQAVQVWFPQRQHAIAHGEADAARPIFDGIARQQLDPPERKAIDIIRAELHQLAQQNDDPYMVAYAQRALGQAGLAAADLAAAEQHFRGALALFRQLDIPGEIAATEQLIADLPARPGAEHRATESS
jgi:hypothetical protein